MPIAETLEIEGWKGIGEFQLYKVGDVIRVVEYRKNKETGEIATEINDVPAQNIEIVWNILIKKAALGEIYGYRWLMKQIQDHYKLCVDAEAWNGGVNRRRYYFPLHYHPLKILEAKGYIKYFGRGSIMRLKGRIL